ncbi:hypothetical protein [Sinorhizobium meliloti]|uniref:hypothetical protein n=1 Tax=Rhizobium meliloti TaxID=382 RepID=UPI003F5CD21D
MSRDFVYQANRATVVFGAGKRRKAGEWVGKLGKIAGAGAFHTASGTRCGGLSAP